MALGKLFHYAFDAVLVSTVFAGVRRTSGLTPDTTLIADENIRSVAQKYFGIGESIFDMIQGTAVNSKYFKRNAD